MVVVEHRHPDGGWRQLPPLPRPRRGSGSVRWEGELMVALFGWNEDGVPGVWIDVRPSLDLGSERLHLGHDFLRVADLTEGPYELDGPVARWRWRLTEE